jgi:hypothetical protein
MNPGDLGARSEAMHNLLSEIDIWVLSPYTHVRPEQPGTHALHTMSPFLEKGAGCSRETPRGARASELRSIGLW